MRGPADLFQRELLIFVGKGGVGKTTTSAAVALRLAKEGRRTLLVTVDPAKRLKDALGVDVGHRLKEVKPNLHAMMLDPEKVIDEYLRENYPDQDMTQSPFYKYISNYMPGINELLAIGKLIEFRQEKHFDTIVIDTAPTGHALSFLTTPLKVRDLFRENALLRWTIRGYSFYQKFAKGGRALGKVFGGKKGADAPNIDIEKLFRDITQHVGAIQELMADPSKTNLIVVTLPEKLPVEESIELHRYISKELKIHIGYIVVNKVQPDVLLGLTKDVDKLAKDPESQRRASEALAAHDFDKSLIPALLKSAEFNQIRREMNLQHIEDLTKRLPSVTQIHLPLHRRDIAGLERLELFEAEFFKGLERVAPLPRAR
ncbi:MAG: ArsA family ATPase [Euryarchaeota archaeon]|nr:ArsA family ATPase [Euryarchaeota archaeon]